MSPFWGAKPILMKSCWTFPQAMLTSDLTLTHFIIFIAAGFMVAWSIEYVFQRCVCVCYSHSPLKWFEQMLPPMDLLAISYLRDNLGSLHLFRKTCGLHEFLRWTFSYTSAVAFCSPQTTSQPRSQNNPINGHNIWLVVSNMFYF